MAKIPTIPSLGLGWIVDPPHQLNTMFAHALVADNSQSTVYAGNITSIPYLIATYQTSQIEMATELEASLQTFFSRVFPITSVTVDYDEAVGNKYQLYVSINVTANGNNYSLSAAIAVDNGVLLTVVKELNA